MSSFFFLLKQLIFVNPCSRGPGDSGAIVFVFNLFLTRLCVFVLKGYRRESFTSRMSPVSLWPFFWSLSVHFWQNVLKSHTVNTVSAPFHRHPKTLVTWFHLPLVFAVYSVWNAVNWSLIAVVLQQTDELNDGRLVRIHVRSSSEPEWIVSLRRL